MNRKIKSILSLAIIFFGIQVTYIPLVIVNEQLRHPPFALEIDPSEIPSGYSTSAVEGYADATQYFSVEGPTQYTEPPSYSAHWYKGSVSPWYLNPSTTTYLSVDIKTPNGLPGNGEFYYVLLSCIDSAGSYDQIGFSADYGHWGLTWSWTEVDFWGGYTYHYDPSAITLSTNTHYRFEMSLSNGYLTYSMSVGGWTEWTKTVYTGGTYFILNENAWVGIHLYTCFTNYEEIWYTDHQTPDFDFKFRNTQTASGYWDNWNVFDVNAPSGIGVTISTTHHYVYVTNPDAP